MWTKLGDEMPDRPSIWRLSHGAFRLHVSGLAYCNRMLLEGIVPGARVQALIPQYRPAYVDELVAGGIWAREGDDFRILDSAEDQLTKADVLALRDKRAAAGRRGGLVSGKNRRRGANSEAKSEANGAASAWGSASSKREANGNPGPVPGPRGQESTNLSIVSTSGKPNGRESNKRGAAADVGAMGLDQFVGSLGAIGTGREFAAAQALQSFARGLDALTPSELGDLYQTLERRNTARPAAAR